jgi:hypothetical protein
VVSGGGQQASVFAKDRYLQSKIRARVQTLLLDPSSSSSLSDLASRRHYASALVDMLRKAEKKGGRDADKPGNKKQADNKKQKDQKKPPKLTGSGKQPQKARSAPETTPERPRPADQ